MAKVRIPSGNGDPREDITVSSNEAFDELWIMQDEYLDDSGTPNDQHFISISEGQIDALIDAIQSTRQSILHREEQP